MAVMKSHQWSVLFLCKLTGRSSGLLPCNGFLMIRSGVIVCE